MPCRSILTFAACSRLAARWPPAGRAPHCTTALPQPLPLSPHLPCPVRRVLPPLQATVFAIYDADRVLQYVGFSKGLRDSLRTLFSRRPEKAQYFK